MGENEKIFDKLTEIQVEQAKQGTELEALTMTSMDTNKRVGKLEQDVAVLKDARKNAADMDTKVMKAVTDEDTQKKKGNKAVWVALITAIGALLAQMIGCMGSLLSNL